VNRGPVAEISLSALCHNLTIVRRIAGKRPIMAVVKADAYGHGSIAISRKLISSGVTYLAVAFTGEAKTLRDAGINAKIIVLFDKTDIPDYFDYDLIPVIQDIGTARAFSKEAVRRRTRIPVHVKIDTGMGRIGFKSNEAVSYAVRISEMEGIELEGLMSHFSEADLQERSYAFQQLKIFKDIKRGIVKKTGRPVLSHITNSAAVLSFKGALLDAVRPGLLIYGYSPFKDRFGECFGLTPLMKVKTRILTLRNLPSGSPVSYAKTFITKRKSKIAVIPVGYADGYNRLFSNNAEVLVGGRRAPVVGRVCMDLTMVDVTDIRGIAEGDEVVLLGGQGHDVITASELSSRIDTIPYDIITSLGSKARKEYTE
jgi:alanine racemase